MEGYNASLFAYGQTGSGKSYSVIGYGQNKGMLRKHMQGLRLNASSSLKSKTQLVMSRRSQLFHIVHEFDVLVCESCMNSV